MVQLIRRRNTNCAFGNEPAPHPIVVRDHCWRIQMGSVTQCVAIANDNDVMTSRNR